MPIPPAFPTRPGNLRPNPFPESVVKNPYVAFFLFPVLIQPPGPAAQTLWTAKFQDAPEGAYAEARAKTDFGPFLDYVSVPSGRATIKSDAASGHKVLEVKYPAGCVGPAECAMQVRSTFPAQESAWTRYRIRFESGFDWNKGGKLPGLCGGQCNTGCVGVSGQDGWSARMMWHAGGKMVQYLYYPDKTNSCGDDLAWNGVTLETGRWYEIMNQVVLNTPGTAGGAGKHDGILRAWLDGAMVLEKKDIRFRDAATVRLDAFYFSTFHGGSDASWGPGHDSYASFSDLIVTAGDPRIAASLPNPGKAPAGSGGVAADTGPAVSREGSALRIRHSGSGPLHLRLFDTSGMEAAALEMSGPGERFLVPGPRRGLYILRWFTPRTSGSVRFPML